MTRTLYIISQQNVPIIFRLIGREANISITNNNRISYD